MVKKQYRIVVLQAGPHESVILGLVPIYTVHASSTREDPKMPDPTKVFAGPAGETEDARQGREMMKGMMDGMLDSLQKAGVPVGRGPNVPPDYNQLPRIPLLDILLSKQEYEELGKPVPNETISFTLTLDRHTEPQQNSEDEPHV